MVNILPLSFNDNDKSDNCWLLSLAHHSDLVRDKHVLLDDYLVDVLDAHFVPSGVTPSGFGDSALQNLQDKHALQGVRLEDLLDTRYVLLEVSLSGSGDNAPQNRCHDMILFDRHTISIQSFPSVRLDDAQSCD